MYLNGDAPELDGAATVSPLLAVPGLCLFDVPREVAGLHEVINAPPHEVYPLGLPEHIALDGQVGKARNKYRVKIAHSGEKALTICQADDPPDLILLDIMMPGLDGFGVAKALRNHPSSAHIPIIFVTALTDDASRMRGMEMGAVDFISKPIDPHKLRLRVRNFMRYIALHRELQANYDTMLEAARLKEEVEQISRHDLKGGLAAVIGLVQGLAQAASLDQDQREQLQLAEQAALQVLNMINLSAEIYKIETGRFQLQPQAVDLSVLGGRGGSGITAGF